MHTTFKGLNLAVKDWAENLNFVRQGTMHLHLAENLRAEDLYLAVGLLRLFWARSGS